MFLGFGFWVYVFGVWAHVGVVLPELGQQVGQPVAPGQHPGVTVAVQVGVVLQQLLGQDVVGHHREVKRSAAARWSGVATAVGGDLPVSLKSWGERKRRGEMRGRL